jgi:hypothetical protein
MVAGSKVALLVEDVVEGQQHLVLLEEDLPFVEQNGRVDGLFAGAGRRGSATPTRMAVGSAVACELVDGRGQRARKLGLSSRSAGG